MSNKEQRVRRKVRRSYITSTISIALVLFMLGAVSYVTLSAISAADALKDSVVISVEVADDLSEESREALLSCIDESGITAEVAYLDKDTKFADEEFRSQFEIDLDLLLGENPLRNSYEVTLSAEHATREDVEYLAEVLLGMDGVEYVMIPPTEMVERMHTTISHVSVALLVFLGVLLVISMLLLNNTIRLVVYSKRYLINTMKLVGATKWYIMRPFLGNALIQGVVAGVIASVLMCGMVYGTHSFAIDGIKMLDYREVGVIVGAIVLVGVVITVSFSAFAVNKFVNMRTNKIHLY
ncbi:MAG: permease-like cell division protein FtsX [Alistipes sp.]|nr:permease-like cell division protein FtsX [Alistipes sp.]